VQRAYFERDPRPDDADGVIGRVNDLVGRAREAGAPVILIQHEDAGDGTGFGSAGWELAGGLGAMPADPRIRKTTPDSFHHTGLLEFLRRLGVGWLVVCGYATEYCVDTTTRRGSALGFPVALASDAHTTHDKPHASAAQIRTHHNRILPEVGSYGPAVDVVPARDIRFG
jgi:nicotinamidase-related amidase